MSRPPDFPKITGQRGLATVPQLLAAGWTRSAIRHARATMWQEPMPRVLAPHRGGLDAATQLVAEWLWAGDTVLTGGGALTVLGLDVRPVRDHTFIAPMTARARQHGHVRVVRSSRPVETAEVEGIVPVATGARALVDAALYERHVPERLEMLTINLLQRGKATPERLEEELHTRPLGKVAGIWRGLEAFTQGAWSMPEKVLREVVESDGSFPELLTNVTLETEDGAFVGCPDGYLREASTVIQVHSRQFHQGFDDLGGDRWARTVEKDAAYTAAGLRCVGVSPWTLYRQPKRFLASLRKVVALGLEGPPARVRVRR